MALTTLKRTKALQQAERAHSEESNASGSDSGSGSEAEDAAGAGNVGWADSIAKVLNTTKPKTKKTLVLSRAKKIKASDKTKAADDDCGFEVDGELKEEKPDKEELQEKLQEKLKPRKNVPLALRSKPSWKDLERERTLRKVATRGVVQLFNAVRIQQKDLQHQLADAGPLDSRKEAILNNISKRKFLDVLMSGSRAKSLAVDNPVKAEPKAEHGGGSSDDDDDDDDSDNSAAARKKSGWNVLRDDFMTNKKIKHWDEEDEEGDSSDNKPEASDGSDDDGDGDGDGDEDEDE